jgi:hypothetical protein
MAERIPTFREFWPYYLGQHRTVWCRRLHFFGTTLTVIFFSAAIATRQPWLLLAAAVGGYGPAWIGHFFVEKNRPATFRYPLWSLAADFRMYGKMWMGAMDQELARLGIAS